MYNCLYCIIYKKKYTIKIVHVFLKNEKISNMALNMKKELRSLRIPKNRTKSMEQIFLNVFLPSTANNLVFSLCILIQINIFSYNL